MDRLLPELLFSFFFIADRGQCTGEIFIMYPVPCQCLRDTTDNTGTGSMHTDPPVIEYIGRKWSADAQQFFFEHTGMSMYRAVENKFVCIVNICVIDFGSHSP